MMGRNLKLSDRWKIFFLIEMILLLISIVMPITPSKTGSSTRLAEWFIKNPSYFEEVIFYLVFGNIITIILGIVFFVWNRITKKQSH